VHTPWASRVPARNLPSPLFQVNLDAWAAVLNLGAFPGLHVFSFETVAIPTAYPSVH
jgi:hypothetical protein